MDAQTIIARRVAQELRPGNLVNLGIGIPTLVANYVPEGLNIFFQSENGLIGTGPIPEQGMAHPLLTDAGGKPISALPGAATFDSAMSFGLIRGGHVDVTVLGGLQVDEAGHLANWMIPGKMVPGMGGAMDLVSGAKRVIVAMQHAAKGKSKIVAKCNLPLTGPIPEQRRHGPVTLTEARLQDREAPRREQNATPTPCTTARADEDLDVRRGPAEQRRDREPHRADHEHQAAAEAVAEHAAEEDQRAERGDSR